MAEQGKIQVRLVTPERILLNVEATSVEIPSKSGSLEVMPGAAPVLARIGAGMLRVHGLEDGDKSFVISRGIAEVLPQRVTILANTVESIGKVNAEAAEQIEARGQQWWEHAGMDEAAYQEANDLMLEGQMLLELSKQRH